MDLTTRLLHLGEILVALCGAPTPSHQFQTLAEHAPGAIPCDFLAICLVDPDDRGYLVHLLHGVALGALPRRLYRLDEGLPGYAMTINRTLLVADLGRDKRGAADLEGVCARLGLGAALVAPLRQGKVPLGALYLAAKAPRHYGDDDLQIVRLLAAGLSAGLETARIVQSVADERSMMAAVLGSSRDAVLTINSQGTVLLANRAVRDMLNVDEAALIGRPLAGAVDYEPLLNLFTNSQAGVVELALPDGRIAQASLVAVTSAFGERIGWAAILRDITVLKELEEMKNEFVNTVSHDLKNPLSGILLAADLLGRSGPLNSRQCELQQRIRETAEYMNELVSDLLNLGRIEAGLGLVVEPFDFVGLALEVDRALRPLAEEKDQHLQLTAPPTLLLTADRSQVRQVLLNLVGNAIKYTAPDGRISIEVERSDRAAMLPGAVTDDRHAHLLVVRVADSGVGIPAASLPHVFDKFFRVADDATRGIKGTGLGLAIARGIVEVHGGRIWAESTEGEGSTFAFYLPLD